MIKLTAIHLTLLSVCLLLAIIHLEQVEGQMMKQMIVDKRTGRTIHASFIAKFIPKFFKSKKILDKSKVFQFNIPLFTKNTALVQKTAGGFVARPTSIKREINVNILNNLPFKELSKAIGTGSSGLGAGVGGMARTIGA